MLSFESRKEFFFSSSSSFFFFFAGSRACSNFFDYDLQTRVRK